MGLKCGDIVVFKTAKAAKTPRRRKYHLCISFSGKLFLFINTNPFEGSFALDAEDWPEHPNTPGHVSCNAPVRYAPFEWKRLNVSPAGRLTDDALRRLMDHVNQSDVMPEADIDDVVNALASFLRE